MRVGTKTGYGAIVGDIIGSRFEWNNIKTKQFYLFSNNSIFTDDTVLTIAIMDCLNKHKNDPEKHAANYLKKWALKYKYAGYGSTFIHWMYSDNNDPYYSCGNGSAMRVSAVGWICDTLEETEKLAELVTAVTHNHPDGIAGAKATAGAIFLARTGHSKDEIKAYVEKFYDLSSLDYEYLRRTYYHGAEICSLTVPQAVYCFLISNDFEDCMRTTVSIGGDTDTLCAINGPIAEAFWGIPTEIIQKAETRIPREMKRVIRRFNRRKDNVQIRTNNTH